MVTGQDSMGVAAGITIIVISIAHIIYGERIQVPALKKIANDQIMIGSLRIMIFQGGILLLTVGIIQELTSLNMKKLTGISAYSPLGIVLLNFMTSLSIAAIFHPEVFKTTRPQFVVFAIIIIPQILSI